MRAGAGNHKVADCSRDWADLRMYLGIKEQPPTLWQLAAVYAVSIKGCRIIYFNGNGISKARHPGASGWIWKAAWRGWKEMQNHGRKEDKAPKGQ